MIALYIIGGILLLIALLLLLPITAQIKFENDFFLKIKFLGLTVYELKNEKEEKAETEKPKEKSEESKPKEKEQGIFFRLKAKHGFKGAIKEIFNFVGKVISEVKPQLLKIKFRKFKLDLIVVGSDAAMTALEYGAVCGIVYPVLSFIDQNLNINLKQINVSAGFKHLDSQFSVSFNAKANALLLLIIAFKALKEYKNFSVRNEL
ncbi:MAG: DUF2953 domain-containing protein [Clostridia bacterium]|nr:DUF2953 domain-containing protein [Clostridia bacterium]